MKKLVAIAAVVSALVVVLAVTSGGDDADTASAGTATAPIAPRGLPATAVCATDAPGEGVEAEEARTVQLPLPDPGRFGPSTPQRAVAEFMDAWRDRAWDRMALWTAPSWGKLTPGDEGRFLRSRYGTYRLRGWAFTGTPQRDPRTARLRTIVAHRDVAPRIERETLRFVVTRENPDGELVVEGGRWGVFLSEGPDAPAGCPAR